MAVMIFPTLAQSPMVMKGIPASLSLVGKSVVGTVAHGYNHRREGAYPAYSPFRVLDAYGAFRSDFQDLCTDQEGGFALFEAQQKITAGSALHVFCNVRLHFQQSDMLSLLGEQICRFRSYKSAAENKRCFRYLLHEGRRMP